MKRFVTATLLLSSTALSGYASQNDKSLEERVGLNGLTITHNRVITFLGNNENVMDRQSEIAKSLPFVYLKTPNFKDSEVDEFFGDFQDYCEILQDSNSIDETHIKGVFKRVVRDVNLKIIPLPNMLYPYEFQNALPVLNYKNKFNKFRGNYTTHFGENQPISKNEHYTYVDVNKVKTDVKMKEFLARVWKIIKFHPIENERDQMKDNLVRNIGNCNEDDGHITCNIGKTGRILQAIEGYISGIEIVRKTPDPLFYAKQLRLEVIDANLKKKYTDGANDPLANLLYDLEITEGFDPDTFELRIKTEKEKIDALINNVYGNLPEAQKVREIIQKEIYDLWTRSYNIQWKIISGTDKDGLKWAQDYNKKRDVKIIEIKKPSNLISETKKPSNLINSNININNNININFLNQNRVLEKRPLNEIFKETFFILNPEIIPTYTISLESTGNLGSFLYLKNSTGGKSNILSLTNFDSVVCPSIHSHLNGSHRLLALQLDCKKKQNEATIDYLKRFFPKNLCDSFINSGIDKPDVLLFFISIETTDDLGNLSFKPHRLVVSKAPSYLENRNYDSGNISINTRLFDLSGKPLKFMDVEDQNSSGLFKTNISVHGDKVGVDNGDIVPSPKNLKLSTNDLPLNTTNGVYSLLFYKDTKIQNSPTVGAITLHWLLGPKDNDTMSYFLQGSDSFEHLLLNLSTSNFKNAKEFDAVKKMLDFENLYNFDLSTPPSSRYSLVGFSSNEPDGTWTDGKKASFSCTLSSLVKKPSTVAITFVPFCFNRAQRVIFKINDSEPVERLCKELVWQDINLKIPNVLRDEVKINIEVPDATAPKTVGYNADPRTLGIKVMSIKFS